VIHELKKYRVWQMEIQLQFGIPYSEVGYITSNLKGEPLNPNYVYNHFFKMIEKAGVKKIRFHDLRHTHATIMLQLGEHPKVVSERLGHSSIEMAMNTYSHVTSDTKQESSDRFERAMRTSFHQIMWSKCGQITKKAQPLDLSRLLRFYVYITSPV
jgi:integrase